MSFQIGKINKRWIYSKARSALKGFSLIILCTTLILSQIPTPAFADGGGQCASPSGQCAGEGEESGGGGGGGGAGDILGMIAAIIAPIAAAAAAIASEAIRADADKDIARMSTTAALAQTHMQQQTTMELAQKQQDIAMANQAATMELAKQQQDSANWRLQTQMAAIEKERVEEKREREEIRMIEERRANEQIAFAQQQADEQLKLAQQTYNAQLTQASLSTGLTPTNSATGGLSITGGGAPGMGQLRPGQVPINPNSNQIASATNPGATGTSAAFGNTTTLPNSGGATFGITSSNSGSFTRGIASTQSPVSISTINMGRVKSSVTTKKSQPVNTSSRLLSALRTSTGSSTFGSSLVLNDSSPTASSRGAYSRSKKVNGRYVASKKPSTLKKNSKGRSLSNVMQSHRTMVLGSTRAFHNRDMGYAADNSDLKMFTQAVSQRGTQYSYRPRAASTSGRGVYSGGTATRSLGARGIGR